MPCGLRTIFLFFYTNFEYGALIIADNECRITAGRKVFAANAGGTDHSDKQEEHKNIKALT